MIADRRRFTWPVNFPKVLIQTSGYSLKSHSCYRKAKTGDLAAAVRLVHTFGIGEHIVKFVREGIAPTMISVRSEDREANRIPEAFARAMAESMGNRFDDSVVLLRRGRRGDTRLADRFVRRCAFYGEVHRGHAYILVDDFVTTGGTLADFVAFIQKGGGIVLGAVVLAAAFSPHNGSSAQLAILPSTLRGLDQKFGRSAVRRCLHPHGLGATGLTNIEGRWLLSFKSLATLGLS